MEALAENSAVDLTVDLGAAGAPYLSMHFPNGRLHRLHHLSVAGGQPLEIAFGRADAGQHFVGQRQHAQAGGGQARGPGAAVQQGRAQPGFEVAQLMRQRGLGQVQAFGGLLQAAAFTDRRQRL